MKLPSPKDPRVRRWLPYFGVIAGAVVAVYFAPSQEGRSIKKDIERRGTPCIAVQKTRADPSGVPSEGCFRLFGLLMEVCDRRPQRCARTARRALVSQPRLLRMDILRSFEELGSAGGGRQDSGAPRTAPTPAPAPGSGGGSGPRGSVPTPQPGQPPSGGGGGGGGSPGGGGPPGPLDSARDTVNDLTEQLGFGRPVPPLPPLLNPPRLGGKR